MQIKKRVEKLWLEGFSYEQIKLILLQETGKSYSIGTVKVYSRMKFDLEKDDELMSRWRAEYEDENEPTEEERLLEKMYLLAKEEGILN